MAHHWIQRLTFTDGGVAMYDNAVSYVHDVLSRALGMGSVAIDATVGNGWDTAFMAELVGSSGVVYGFDIQQLALDVTRTRTSNLNADVRLFRTGHEEMLTCIDTAHLGKVNAITFNLGYLPGGDEHITTVAETTRRGLDQARAALAPDGVLTVVCYRHAEGETELAMVRDFLSTWPQQRYTVVEVDFVNQVNKPPVVFVVSGRAVQPNTLRI